MRQDRSETVLAVALALGLHVALILLLVFGLQWTRGRAEPAFGVPVSADIIDPDALSMAQRRALANEPEPLPPPPAPEPEPVEEPAAPPPQPEPVPVPEDAPEPPQPVPQERLPEPDTVDQDAARREAESELAAEREQEERRRQEQIDLTERKRQQEEAERQRRLQQQREELEKLRAEREKSRREAELAEQKLRQIADARASQASEAAASSASPPPGRPDGDSDLAARYAAALQEAIARNWTRPDSVTLGQRCRLYITQLPGGQVMNVEFDPSCPYDALGRRSVEAAVRKAEPLPYRGFEPVFARRLNLNFTAEDR